jgi:phospholipid/cholesterol/gamma-HCH transport system permease protein
MMNRKPEFPENTIEGNSISDVSQLKHRPPGGIAKFFIEAGGLTKFFGLFLREVWRPPYEVREILDQMYKVGYTSLPLVGITSYIMGLVLTIQSRPTLAEFGAESMLPSMVAISIVREIGPVITALITAGKAGSSIGAELGSMKVTEQIDAMEVSATNPIKYIVVSRVLATTFMIPILVILADAISLIGSFTGVNIKGNVSFTLYISQAINSLSFSDIIPATIKTFFFGLAIGLVACYKGYYTENGTEGVGRSANSAVVYGSLMIFIIDMIAVQLTDLLTK